MLDKRSLACWERVSFLRKNSVRFAGIPVRVWPAPSDGGERERERKGKKKKKHWLGLGKGMQGEIDGQRRREERGTEEPVERECCWCWWLSDDER